MLKLLPLLALLPLSQNRSALVWTLPEDEAECLAIGRRVGYPVIIKASGGGGGRGMRLVADADELSDVFERCRSEAAAAFGDGSLFVEHAVVDVNTNHFAEHHCVRDRCIAEFHDLLDATFETCLGFLDPRCSDRFRRQWREPCEIELALAPIKFSG